jgi:hypothetical protein
MGFTRETHMSKGYRTRCSDPKRVVRRIGWCARRCAKKPELRARAHFSPKSPGAAHHEIYDQTTYRYASHQPPTPSYEPTSHSLLSLSLTTLLFLQLTHMICYYHMLSHLPCSHTHTPPSLLPPPVYSTALGFVLIKKTLGFFLDL